LEAGEVNYVRNGMITNGPLQASDIGDISLNKAYLTQAVLIEKQTEAMNILLEVINPHTIAVLDKRAGNPTPDAPITAG
jgi:hypothetical protein